MKVIILAGGSGTRLWPLSRERYPKQFVKLPGARRSLFQESFSRSLLLTGPSDIYVVTNAAYKFLIMGQVEELECGYDEDHILIEPEARNTLPAICAGVGEITKKGDDCVAVFPSDHLIRDDAAFAALVKASEKLTKSHIVTFGITPDRPHTGYGYILPGKALDVGFQVKAFMEKPSRDKALEYIEKGSLWNAGIFLFDTALFNEEVSTYAPEVFSAFKTSDNIRDAFSKIKTKISVDYAVMEKSSRVAVVPADIGWNDLGSFDSFREIFQTDENGNILPDDTVILESTDNLIYTDEDKLVAAVGVEGLIVIDNRDALLVCKKDESQEVRQIVDTLKKRGDPRTSYHVQDYRPWGHYKVLEEEKGAFKIKRLTIHPKKKVSYQLHYHRSEHWVVVRGMARVTVDGEVKLVSAGESIYLKPGQKHRLENPGKTMLEVIEVQMGEYLEEDDIIRFDDDYGRKQE